MLEKAEEVYFGSGNEEVHESVDTQECVNLLNLSCRASKASDSIPQRGVQVHMECETFCYHCLDRLYEKYVLQHTYIDSRAVCFT